MALSWDIGRLMGTMEQMGFFYFVIPFLIIFAIVFAVLEKSKWLGDNKPVQVIISVGVGLLTIRVPILQDFFENIFPKMGIGLAILLVFLIIMGFFVKFDESKNSFMWVGFVVVALVLLWTAVDFGFLGGGYGYRGFWEILNQQWPALVLAGLAIGGFVWVIKHKDKTP